MNNKKCKSCASDIPKAAKICPFCKNNQKWYLNFRISDLLLFASILLSFFMVLFSYLNFHEARKERIKAEEAAKLAYSAANTASTVQNGYNNLAEKVSKAGTSLNGLTERIKNVDQTVTKTNRNIHELKSQSDFVITFNKAQSGDRASFDMMLAWRNDASSPYQKQAESAVYKIMNDHQPIITGDPIDAPWKQGFDPSVLTIQNLYDEYNKAGRYKNSIIKYMWNRQDFTKKEKMQFLVNIFENEQDLNVIEYAGRCFLQESKEKVYNIAIGDHLGWWNKHKDEIK